MLEAVLEDLDRAPDVDPEILCRISEGEFDRRLAGDVEDRIRDRIEGLFQIFVGTDITWYEICGRCDVAPTAGALVVDHAH